MSADEAAALRFKPAVISQLESDEVLQLARKARWYNVPTTSQAGPFGTEKHVITGSLEELRFQVTRRYTKTSDSFVFNYYASVSYNGLMIGQTTLQHEDEVKRLYKTAAILIRDATTEEIAEHRQRVDRINEAVDRGRRILYMHQ